MALLEAGVLDALRGIVSLLSDTPNVSGRALVTCARMDLTLPLRSAHETVYSTFLRMAVQPERESRRQRPNSMRPWR